MGVIPTAQALVEVPADYGCSSGQGARRPSGNEHVAGRSWPCTGRHYTSPAQSAQPLNPQPVPLVQPPTLQPLPPVQPPVLQTLPPEQGAVIPPQPQVAQQPAIPFGPFLGEVLCPLPENIRAKILRPDYVNIADLRPEAWLFESEQNTEKTVANLFKKRRDPVTDIRVWVQCYSSLVAVLAEQYPQYIKHFLAYLSTVVGCCKRYKGLSWAAYDAAFRRKAAVQRSLAWGIVDYSLFAIWFSG